MNLIPLPFPGLTKARSTVSSPPRDSCIGLHIRAAYTYYPNILPFFYLSRLSSLFLFVFFPLFLLLSFHFFHLPAIAVISDLGKRYDILPNRCLLNPSVEAHYN